MQSKVVRMLALAVLLCGVGIGLGQQQYPGAKDGVAVPPKQGKKIRVEDEEEAPRGKQKAPQTKSQLERMLAEALKNNPDIRVAAAKLAEADAELNRTRLQVTQKVVTLHHAIESQKATLDYLQKKYDRKLALRQQRAIEMELVDKASDELMAAKAKLAELEAQIPALLGKTAHADIDLDSRLDVEEVNPYYREIIQGARLEREKARRKVVGPLAERMRKALQTPVKVDYKEVSLTHVFTGLENKAPGLSLRYDSVSETKVTVHFDEALPVSAILQALADDYDLRFTVRDYGIRVTSTRVPAPPGALTIEEFLRQKPAEQPRSQPASGKNPPPNEVEGHVKNIDASGLMTLSIGSDAGLVKGHTLELYRMTEKPKYLGTVRIIETDTKQSVAQPVGRLTAPPQKGDRVASRIP
jgi:hypothetical protein